MSDNKMPWMNFKVEDETVRFSPIGDVHIGSRACNYSLLRKHINYCVDNRIYVIGMGDWANLNLKSSKGSIYEDDMTPKQQQQACIDIFSPLANAGLLLYTLSGNHEDRLYREVGIHFMDSVAEKLGVPHYGPSANLLINQPNSRWEIFTTHGNGSGATLGSKMNRLDKYAQVCPGADVILGGHHHVDTNSSVKSWFRNPNGVGGAFRTRHMYTTGSYQEWEGYARAMNLQPSRLGSWVFTLEQRKHGSDQKRLTAMFMGD